MASLGRNGAAQASAFLLAAVPGVCAAGTPCGALYLSTLPTGANVWIDGTYVGRTPVLVDPVARGHHAVTLTKTGWTVREVDVDVAVGATEMLTYRLAVAAHPGAARPQGIVVFRGLSDSARVSVDGDAVQHAAGVPVAMRAGPHVALVTSPSGSVTRTFSVYPGTTTDVLVTEVVADDRPSGIVAPAEEYLPDAAYAVDGRNVVVRYAGHHVTAHLGDPAVRFDGVPVSYDAAPSRINGRLYLPLALLTRLTAAPAK